MDSLAWHGLQKWQTQPAAEHRGQTPDSEGEGLEGSVGGIPEL